MGRPRLSYCGADCAPASVARLAAIIAPAANNSEKCLTARNFAVIRSSFGLARRPGAISKATLSAADVAPQGQSGRMRQDKSGLRQKSCIKSRALKPELGAGICVSDGRVAAAPKTCPRAAEFAAP